MSRSEKHDHYISNDSNTGQRKSDPFLLQDARSSIQQIPNSPLPPSPPRRSHTPTQVQSSPPHSSTSAATPPVSHHSPPHPSQSLPPGFSGSLVNSPSIQSQLLTSITQRAPSMKADGGHRRFSDIDVATLPHEKSMEGDNYSPRPDRKVRKSNSVKDTIVHGIGNRPPYPIPSSMATHSSDMSPRVTGGKVSAVC